MEDRAGELGGVARHVSGQGPRRFTTCGLAPLLPFSKTRGQSVHGITSASDDSGDPSIAAKPNSSLALYHTLKVVNMGRTASR
jgi:hypothetical protein